MGSTKVPEKSYLSTAELDSLARIQTEMLSELWILKDRVMILEHLLTQSNILIPDQIDNYDISPTLERELKLERDKLAARVMGAGHRRELCVDEIKANEKTD